MVPGRTFIQFALSVSSYAPWSYISKQRCRWQNPGDYQERTDQNPRIMNLDDLIKKEGDTCGKVMGIFGHETRFYNIEI
jgi:hypothetical protein